MFFADILTTLQHGSIVWAWGVFLFFVFLMLALDLGVFHRKSHVVGFKEAMIWSVVWVCLGLSFSLLIRAAYDQHWFGLGMLRDAVDGVVNDGKSASLKYLTAYVVEKSLSLDNIFVISVLFSSLLIPDRYQHRVLMWGILGALIMRGVMIGGGALLVQKFHWILYVFGVFLLFTGLKMLWVKEREEGEKDSPLLNMLRRILPVTRRFHGQHFFLRAGGKWAAEPDLDPSLTDPVIDQAPAGKLFVTPLFVALILIEIMDLTFALDSIPAVFAITADPFLVFTSNIFAILGLRSLYFALAGLLRKFVYLKKSLSLILIFVGVKMLAAEPFKAVMGEHYNLAMLLIIFGIFLAGIVASLLVKPARPAA